MRKLLTTAVALTAFLSSLAFSTAPASAQHAMNHPRCGRGMHWVAPHRDREGHWVRGHCAPRR
jgi:Spy/CpxP family protein refolding chaperone